MHSKWVKSTTFKANFRLLSKDGITTFREDTYVRTAITFSTRAHFAVAMNTFDIYYYELSTPNDIHLPELCVQTVFYFVFKSLFIMKSIILF